MDEIEKVKSDVENLGLRSFNIEMEFWIVCYSHNHLEEPNNLWKNDRFFSGEPGSSGIFNAEINNSEY